MLTRKQENRAIDLVYKDKSIKSLLKQTDKAYMKVFRTAEKLSGLNFDGVYEILINNYEYFYDNIHDTHAMYDVFFGDGMRQEEIMTTAVDRVHDMDPESDQDAEDMLFHVYVEELTDHFYIALEDNLETMSDMVDYVKRLDWDEIKEEMFY